MHLKNPLAAFLFPLILLSCFLTACSDSADTPTEEAVEAVPVETKVEIPDAPDEAMRTIVAQLAEGNGGILWQAMPASYQTDVNELAQLAGSQLDAELYDRSFSMIARLVEVAQKQKAFILGTQLGGPQDPDQIARIEAAWPSIIGFLESITNSSIASTGGLQAFDGERFFNVTVSELLNHVEALSALGDDPVSFDDYKDVAIKMLDLTETSVTLETTSPEGVVESEALTKVEGRWVPSELAEGWASEFVEAKAKLEALDPAQIAQQKPQIMTVFSMIDGVLIQIEAAETQEQFDQALQGAMMPLMGIMMMGQGMGNGAPSLPVAPAAP